MMYLFFHYSSVKYEPEPASRRIREYWETCFSRADVPGEHIAVLRFTEKSRFYQALRDLEYCGKVVFLRCQEKEIGFLVCIGISFRYAEKLAFSYNDGAFQFFYHAVPADRIPEALGVSELEYYFHKPLMPYMSAVKLYGESGISKGGSMPCS